MAAGRVLVYGGRGALGSVIVEHFKGKGWWVLNVDLFAHEKADENVLVKDASRPLQDQCNQILSDCQKSLGATNQLDAVLCVAGGWAGGNAASKDFAKNAELMLQQSAHSSIVASHLAAKCLRPGGLLQLTGAQPALGATPGMIGYGLAKATVHHMVGSLAAPKSGLPEGACVLAILPVTLDTPMNRKFMPDADHSTWTPLEFVADTLYTWTTEQEKRPKSGSLVQLLTKEGKTETVQSI